MNGPEIPTGEVEQVRRFNRSVTERVGALRDHYLGRGRPIGEARLLWEVGDGAELRALRARLGLDSGYLSRLLRALEGEGLLTVEPDTADRRLRHARLTARGRKERAELDRLSDDLARGILAPLSGRQRGRLLAAMGEVERLLDGSRIELATEDPASAEARSCLAAYFAELDRRFEGGFERGRKVELVEPGFAPPSGTLLVARLRSKAVGCVGLRRLEENVGEIKRMWVDATLRGIGLGARLLAAIEAEAWRIGYRKVRLDTNRALVEAIALYRRSGYREIPRYHRDDAYGDFFFEKELAPAEPERGGRRR